MAVNTTQDLDAVYTSGVEAAAVEAAKALEKPTPAEVATTESKVTPQDVADTYKDVTKVSSSPTENSDAVYVGNGNFINPTGLNGVVVYGNKVIEKASIVKGVVTDVLSGKVLDDIIVKNNISIDPGTGDIVIDNTAKITPPKFGETALAATAVALTSSQDIAAVITNVLSHKGTLVSLTNVIMNEGLDGTLEFLGGELTQLIGNTNLLGKLTETIMSFEAMQSLQSLMNTVSGIVDNALKIGMTFINLEETIFSNSVLRGMLAVGSDPLYNNKFINFCLRGDYWYTVEFVIGENGNFRNDVVRKFDTYTIRCTAFGAKDVFWAMSKLYYENILDSTDWNKKSRLFRGLFRILRSKTCAPSSLYFNDFFKTFKLEPGLFSSDYTARSNAEIYCQTNGEALSSSDVNRLLPIVKIRNPITGKKEDFIYPIYHNLDNILKGWMSQKYIHPLVHPNLEKRLKYPVYNPILHGTLLDELRELLRALGLDELIPLIVSRDQLISKFISYYKPEPIRRTRFYKGY